MKLFNVALISTLLASCHATPFAKPAQLGDVLVKVKPVGSRGISKRNPFLVPRGSGGHCGTCIDECSNLPEFTWVTDIFSQIQTVQTIDVTASTTGDYVCGVCGNQQTTFSITLTQTITTTLHIHTGGLIRYLRGALGSCRHPYGGTQYSGGSFTLPGNIISCTGGCQTDGIVVIDIGITGEQTPCEVDNSCELPTPPQYPYCETGDDCDQPPSCEGYDCDQFPSCEDDDSCDYAPSYPCEDGTADCLK